MCQEQVLDADKAGGHRLNSDRFGPWVCTTLFGVQWKAVDSTQREPTVKLLCVNSEAMGVERPSRDGLLSRGRLHSDLIGENKEM